MPREQWYVQVTGTGQILQNLNHAVAQIKERSKIGMNEACLAVLAAAIPKTPQSPNTKRIQRNPGGAKQAGSGHLRRSYGHHVFTGFSGINGVVFNTASYAPYVHEIPRQHYTTPGTGWKFLERALQEKSADVLEILHGAVKITGSDTRDVFHGVRTPNRFKRIYGSKGSF